MAKQALAITGCALLTPLDDTPGETGGTWRAIRAGQRIDRRTAIDDRLLDPDIHLDRSIRLALAAARQALGDAPLDAATALFCGTSKGPITTMLQACETLRRGEPLHETTARQVTLGVGAMGTILRERLGPDRDAKSGADAPAGNSHHADHAITHTSVAACASGLHALHRAAQTLWQNEALAQQGDPAVPCRRALVVAADASLHPLFAASFQRLGVLSPPDAHGLPRCEPFGHAGDGFFLTEAAAAIVLECQDLAITRDDPPYAWVEESWSGADGTGLIAIDPQTHSLRAGIRACAGGRGGRDEGLAFVHAHATGTEHDDYELHAIRSVVAPRLPVFSSKGFLGHSLGAAGLVSVALSVQCHVGGSTLTGDYIAPDTTSLTIAQGFGGHIGIVRIRG